VGLIVWYGDKSVLLALGRQLAHLQQVVGENTGNQQLVFLGQERDRVNYSGHLNKAENGVVLGRFLRGNEDFV